MNFNVFVLKHEHTHTQRFQRQQIVVLVGWLVGVGGSSADKLSISFDGITMTTTFNLSKNNKIITNKFVLLCLAIVVPPADSGLAQYGWENEAERQHRIDSRRNLHLNEYLYANLFNSDCFYYFIHKSASTYIDISINTYVNIYVCMYFIIFRNQIFYWFIGII